MDLDNIEEEDMFKRGYYSEIVTDTMRRSVMPKSIILPTATRRTKLSWQTFTERHSAAVKKFPFEKVKKLLGAAERWMTFAEDRSVIFPAESFTPKVQMEQDVEPKHIPRNVEMERRRRLYRNLKIEDALMNEGVSPKDILPLTIITLLTSEEGKYGLFANVPFLPLEIFDDEEFDCRTADDWLALGFVDGVQYPLPAMVFVEKAKNIETKTNSEDDELNDLFGWYPAAVTNYDRNKKLWSVLTLDGYKRSFLLARIHVRFLGEDPRIFARRIASALENRRRAEACIRYQFYLDCMQVDSMPALTDQEKERIISSSRQKVLKYGVKRIESLMDQVDLNHRRTMCDLMWRKLIDRNKEMFEFITWRPKEEIVMVPEKGKIETGMKNFLETKKYLHWITLYVSPAVYDAVVSVVAECIKASNMNLFVSNYGKSMPLTEFETQQNQVTIIATKYLKEQWLEKITQSVRMHLRDIGKGWFNLDQKYHEIYDVMKLKRLMTLITFLMQSAIRILVENSIATYIDMIESVGTCVLNIDESFVWGNNLVDTKFKESNPPIFNVKLMMNKTEVFYSTEPDSFETTIVSLFDNSLRLCHQIRQVYPFLLSFLNFPTDIFLSSVGLLEKEVSEVRDRLREILRKSIIPLKAYANEYRKYIDLHQMDISTYIERFKNEEHTAVEVKEEASFHRKMKQSIENTLPKNICIGLFNVHVHPLRLALMSKHEDCCNRLLTLFTEDFRHQVDEVVNEYMQITTRLNEESRNIEHLFEQKEWIETIPYTVKRIDDRMQKLKIDADILDIFHWNLSDEDFKAKWEAIGFPQRIELLIANTLERLVEEQDKFLKIQIQDEIMLLEKKDTLVGNIGNVAIQTDINKVHEVAIDVRRIWKTMKECQETGLQLNERQKLFELPVVPFIQLAKLMKDFDPYQSLWITASDWLKWYEIWMENPLMTIDGTYIDTTVNEMHRTMLRCVKMFQDLPKVANIALTVRDQIEDFKPYVELIQALRNPGMKPRHFEELSAQTGIQMALTPTLTFKSLIVLGIMQFEDTVRKIAEEAEKEYSIEGTLDKMIATWETITMDVIPYKETGTYIMKIVDETMMLLDDHILNAQQISFSPFKAAFEERIDDWEYKLKLTQEVVTLWIEVQKCWMYLEPIFTTEDISRQLPVETRKFNTMERNWKRIMKTAYECPYIIKICPDRSLLESLKECIVILEIVQKGLSDYLETKRMLFPRFFFLSDDELLDIIAQTKNVRAVQPHLKKCFENMKELKFEDDLQITMMYSAENEEVSLRPPIRPEGNVENWLGEVEQAMRETIRVIIGEALDVIESTPRGEWVYMWPGQVTLCCGQTYWTAHVENGIRNKRLDKYYNVMLSHLNELRELVRGPQTEIQRLMVEAVITIEVHARDILQELIKLKVTNINDFEWISQLRYYWMDDKNLKVRAVNAEFPYGYEYLGNNGRLVITPLTDRCYLTLTNALHLKFGGAPSGPAGTGKTETTKDLAKAFAIQCVVFNCSDQLDFLSMGKFFRGLASAGAWACFDEFNRIDIEVLSVIAQQIMTIQKAQQIRTEMLPSLFPCSKILHPFDIEAFDVLPLDVRCMLTTNASMRGIEITLKASCAVFITMNPGYAGRTELPDNLKALFRPVAMMVPNYALIAEISLFSYGFDEARALAGKITTTFKLSSEQLSTQDHYDFGMRAVKTVIAVAGNLKREQRDLNEQQICLRALRDVNVPKFLKDDLKLFNGIVSDLFLQLEEKAVDYGILEAQIRRSILEVDLADVNEFVEKVIQLYETTLVRHGLMLVGPTGSGKTKCYQVLKDACTKLRGQAQPSGKPFERVHTYVINPKSITMGQLYGEYDLDTHEWSDGTLSTLLRAGTNATDLDKRWYVFDGPVDAVWIENMNTVLDDNKKLCLMSGEIMKLLPTQTMIFEVADLRVASPATVSRCGMVYLEPENLGLEPFIDCWIKSLPTMMSDHAEVIAELTSALVLPGLKMMRKLMNEIVSTVDSGMIQSYINLMNYRISPVSGKEGTKPPSHVFQRTIPVLLSPWAAFSTVWSLGASCDYKGRYIFNDWLRNMQKIYDHSLPFPEEGVVFDYRLHDGGFTDPIEGQEPIPPKWYKWSEDIPSITITPETRYADIEIPTMDSVRHASLIGYLLQNENNVLCVGPTGSGKTLTISGKLSKNMPKKFICDFVTFSARTTANQTQDLVDTKLEKRRKDVYGPTILKKQIFFIDDLNMPALDTYGAQPPIELIRQFMDFSGWYDRKEIGSFKLIEDVNFIGAMGPPGGGRNPITARLLRHFHFIAVPEMEAGAKTRIFRTILKSWLTKTPTFEKLLDPMVDATLLVFSTVFNELLPTPDKSHYTFNLRDLSKVFQGILMADPTTIKTQTKLFLLWYHENVRVFSDRLINDTDRQWFDHLLQEILKRRFNYDVQSVIGNTPLYYGDFCGVAGQYERITDVNKMQKILTEFLEDYNNLTTSPMNLVLFEDAMNHVCRIIRILRQPRSNGLLLGMGGSGRQSLTKLSAHVQEYSCFQVELTRAYSNNDWYEDIKGVMLKAGLGNQPVVFLFSDTQIKSDSMLEDLNNILNCGDVPNIYQVEEIEKINQAMRATVQEAGLQINRSNLFSAYLRVVRNNLHTIITMSPIGELFRSQIRQFPALVNCCTIDWFSPWSESALQTVAMHFLSEIKDESMTESVLKSIVRTCQYMHSVVIETSDRFQQELHRYNYVTPTSYLQLLSNYGSLLKNKKKELNLGIIRLSTGLGKLVSTEVEVKEMQEILTAMKPNLEKAAAATAEMIAQITEETAEAEKMKFRAVQQQDAATKLKEQNQLIKDEAEADLSEAKPMLDAAEASLKALNKNDITEVKAMKRPPVGVLLVIEAMCIVNNVKPHRLPGKLPGEKILDYWTPGSQMLTDAGHFLYMMENYDKSNITEEMINKLKDYIENPNFQPPKILQVSKACYSLCLWVHAMYNYYFVNLKVAPKMQALAKAEQALKETEEAMAMAMAHLKEVQERVQILENKLRTEAEKKADLEKQKQLCEERMIRAVKLIVGLADEQRRWTQILADMKIALRNVMGDILLSSGAIAYLTPFPDTYRQELVNLWYDVLGEGVPHTPDCTPVSTLGDQVEIRRWQLDGLPRDSLSVENAVLAIHSYRWPLFIDPQGQANKWIRNMCKPAGLSIVKIADKDILNILESCVRFGKPCLIENVGTELGAALDPILMKSLFRYGGQICVKIGDGIIPYNFQFRLYLTTRLSNPHYTPEVSAKVLLINFALTASGLLDQMMSLVTIHERPDLEQIRNSLIVSNAEMKKDLKEIEDRILHKLSVSEGSTVDDIDLILTLNASKEKSEEIKAKVEAAENTQADIEATRSWYIPVANRAQILFFCLSDLQNIDTMYQYSLEWFISIFNSSIISTEKTTVIEKRVANINKHFTFNLFSNVCRSLFEKHKLIFAFLLCARIHMDKNLIDPIEWRHFLSEVTSSSAFPNPDPHWISHRCWKEIQSLQLLPVFDNFVESFKTSLAKFKEIFDTQEAHLAAFPEPWKTELDDFRKMLVLKCLRPDKVTNAIQMYLGKYLGKDFLEPQTTEISSLYNESTPTTPLVFVLSTGTDPAAELYKFAGREKMSNKLYSISLGQGQGPRAEAMLRHSIEVGNWVFFQNCHLAPSWMPRLETLVETLSPETHKDFRLWLTSTPSPDFPVSILQHGHKMTIEPPRGIKANMFRAYLTQVIEMEDFIQSEHSKVLYFKRLLFSLCLFHSVLIERRKFGPLGFNIPYEFTNGDLTICMSQLRMFMLEYAFIPYKVLIYTAGHINYGGRITDDWDRRCVLTILEDYYNPNVIEEQHLFDESGIYYQLPATATFNDYIDYIKTLPLNDDPSIFGMHQNTDISFAQTETYVCLETLLTLQPREVSGATTNIEEATIRLAKDMLDTIPSAFNLVAIQERYPIKYKESLNTVLLQEAKRYNDLLNVLKSTLEDLMKALQGFVLMSEQLETTSKSLFNNKIPKIWQDRGYPSLKPLGAWFLDLKERIKFIDTWWKHGIPPAFWISGFFFPQAFLTGTLQNFARNRQVSIDTIHFSFQVLPSKPRQKPDYGCVIYGLYLEGCRWGGQYLTESRPKELNVEMPPIFLLPEVHHEVPANKIYICPVYKTITRAGTLSTTGHSTNFVLAIEIPSQKPQAHWIKRGVALICSLNY